MNAIILAAGEGTRLRPETISIPKGMVKLFDKSLLEMQIDVFKKCSINDISIVTGYLADKITFPSINYFKNENFSSTAGNESIFCAKEKLQDCTIITYGDLVFEKAVIDQVIDFKGDIGIAVELDWKPHYDVRTLHPMSEADNVLFDKDDNILEIRKNIQKPDSKIGEFIGIVKLSKKGSSILLKTSICISSKLLSNNFTIHLGISVVSGCNRVPSPAAKIIAFISKFSIFL